MRGRTPPNRAHRHWTAGGMSTWGCSVLDPGPGPKPRLSLRALGGGGKLCTPALVSTSTLGLALKLLVVSEYFYAETQGPFHPVAGMAAVNLGRQTRG